MKCSGATKICPYNFIKSLYKNSWTHAMKDLEMLRVHKTGYSSGERLSPEHEKAILERLLPYHPQYKKKIGCGIDYITLGLHPEFENSRCLFIVRTDGEQVDFSFWKCIKGLIRQKYPLYADSFILRHFRRRQDY
ncbi:Protein DCL, chloroplastic [Triticum urartu]|uniref:Protein DCL, chloroplastic n=1 Tax=Triticum urartu TaxID=4572 RepID=M7YTW2_TRIUA|nr:Protein DCL, chloroplastic [Triticum urartu]